MEGRHDPDNRGAFPWNESSWDHGLVGLVKALTSLRASSPALRDAEFALAAASADAVAYVRRSGAEGAVVMLNAGTADARLEIHGRFGDLVPVELPGWAGARVSRAGETHAVELAARSGAVLQFGTAA